MRGGHHLKQDKVVTSLTFLGVCERVCECMHACVRACMRACVCVCITHTHTIQSNQA